MAITADWRTSSDWNLADPPATGEACRARSPPGTANWYLDKLVRPDALRGVIRPHEPRGRGRAHRSEVVRRDRRPGLPSHNVIVRAWRESVTALVAPGV